MKKKVLILVSLIILGNISPSEAEINLAASKNYIYILVHSKGTDSGIYDGRKKIDPLGIEYSRLKQYLESEFDLNGYVYSYDFSNNEMDIEHQGWELGDRNYNNPGAVDRSAISDQSLRAHRVTRSCGKGLSMLEQAREDFITWFSDKNKNPKNPTGRQPMESEIPNKYILVCHSMGGLAARHYIYGKGSNGQRYYQNDVAKIVFISTPQLGSNGVVMKNVWNAAEKNAIGYFLPIMGSAMVSGRMLGVTNPITKYLAISAGYVFVTPAIDTIFSSVIGTGNTPAFVDLQPNSEAIKTLNSASSNDEYNVLFPLPDPSVESVYEPLSNRIIYGHGFCTPSSSIVDDINLQRTIPPFAMGMYLINDLGLGGNTEDSADKSDTVEGRIMSFLISMLTGYPILSDGDMFTDSKSVNGDGINSLKDSKKYSYTFHSTGIQALEADIAVLAWGLDLIPGFPPEAKSAVLVGSVIGGIGIISSSEDLKEMWGSHGKILGKVCESPFNDVPAIKSLVEEPSSYSLLSQALFDLPGPGDVHCPGEKDFKLLTDFSTIEGKRTGKYGEIKIMAYNENVLGNNSGISFVIDGKRRDIQNITIKEPPTRVEGVLRDFQPQKMQYFQYSENFAAWKNVDILDEYGRFAVDGLNFGEGQNVLAFRAKNKVGYTSSQILTITLNTIPMQPSNFKPASNSFTKNNMPEFDVDFSKSAYSASSLESINLTKATLRNETTGIETDITSNAQTTISGGTYDKHLKVKYVPKEPLPDGNYSILVSANSNVGVSQAMWTVCVDTRGPTISIDPLKAYSPRAPALIKYSTTDESSSVLGTTRCDLYDKSGNFVTQIATDEGITGGEHSFSWDGVRVADGNYIVKIKVFDLAGNYSVAQTSLIIDSTPPKITSAVMAPKAMSLNFDSMTLEAQVSENSQVIIKLKNKSTGATTSYLSTTTQDNASHITRYSLQYAWQYNNSFTPGPEDGIYDIELAAIDEAGNQSELVTIESFRICRTAPVISEQITMPYVLSNSGANPYTTTLSYMISPRPSLRSGEGGPSQNAMVGEVSVRVKLYNSTTGQLVRTWDNAPNSTEDKNYIEWNADSNDFGKGAYKFQIIAEDDLGNQGTSYATCVKDGIAPVISFPYEDNSEISGTISIRGTAVDPDWTNGKPFKQYRVYYAKGEHLITTKPEQFPDSWKDIGLQIPIVNANGAKPVQNDSTLAYLNTNYLENGTYTILVVVDEDGGESAASTRIVNVNNSSDNGSDQTLNAPFVKLNPIVSDVAFKSDGSVKLPISFINSVKASNIYIEILKSGTQESSVYYKYFPNTPGSPFAGKPAYNPGAELGYFIWQDQSGFHLRFSSDGKSHKISGCIIFTKGQASNFKDQNMNAANYTNMISWDKNISGGECGFDFSAEGQFMLTGKIDDDPSHPNPYASNIFLGITKTVQEYLPIVFDVANNKLVDLMSMGSALASGQAVESQVPLSFEWDGKIDTGAYADSGNYIVRAIAEGSDGFGVSTDESYVNITTPYELSNVEATNKTFSSLSTPDRVSVFYNVSKDSYVSAYVYDESGNYKATILENDLVLGGTNPNNRNSFYWKGNYPNSDSGTVAISGNYSIKLVAKAIDGTDQKEQTISGISIVSSSSDDKIAKLDPIGKEAILNGETVRQAEGESPYYFEARGSGKYYPPKTFNYTLSATGEQRFTTYPYVPFAALVHRGFNTVKIKVVPTVRLWYVHDAGYRFLAGEIYEDRYNEDQKPTSGDITLGDLDTDKNLFISRKDYAPEGIDITKSEVKFKIYAKDYPGFFLDETDWVTIESSTSVDFSSKSVQTAKGMFNIKISDQLLREKLMGPMGVGEIDKHPHQTTFEVGLGSQIKYSRLTNRFIPWFGFVSAKSAVSKDDNFAGYMNNLDKLGFPGDDYFNGSGSIESKLSDAPHRGAFDTSLYSLQGLAEAKNGVTVPKVIEISSKAAIGFDSGTATDYSAYLADEYIEFIPITSPDRGQFELSDGAKIIDAPKSFQGYKDPATLGLIAKTDLVLSPSPESGKSQTPFVFAWPDKNMAENGCITYSDYITKYAINGSNYSDLMANPQNYSGYANLDSKCYYELDGNEISEHEKDPSSKILQGKVYYQKDKDKSYFNSDKDNGQLFPLPSYVETPLYDVTKQNGSINIGLNGAGANGGVYAYDTADPLPWATNDDSTLYATSGAIKSDWKIFNTDQFVTQKELSIFSDAPYKVSKDVASNDALKYSFLASDPLGRISDSPCDNLNLKITNWNIVVKDKNSNINSDIFSENPTIKDSHINDSFTLKLKSNSSEKRFVEITGQSAGPYELQYFDGNTWQSICRAYAGKFNHGRYVLLDKSRFQRERRVCQRAASPLHVYGR